VRIAWDPAKAAANRKKHGVSFEEAATLFTRRTDFLELYDARHGGDEDRFIAIGPIARGVVFVVFVEREEDVIRIVSARPATRRETATYQRWRRGEPT
jgi:hypothetical protein